MKTYNAENIERIMEINDRIEYLKSIKKEIRSLSTFDALKKYQGEFWGRIKSKAQMARAIVCTIENLEEEMAGYEMSFEGESLDAPCTLPPMEILFGS